MAEANDPLGVTDEALMAALQAGDAPALQALHQRYAPLIFSLAARSLGAAGADDIVQEVLLAAWIGRDSYRPELGLLRPWLLQIAHTRVLNELRRRSRHPTDAEGPAGALDTFVDQTEQGPETAAWQTQRQSVLNAALAELPPKEAQALRLAFFEDLSHSEVAAFLKTPLGTVKTRIRSGVGRMFQRLAPWLGPTLLAVFALVAWQERARFDREDRAVRMLSLSDSETLHLAAAEGIDAETHGSFRWHPGIATAVITLSHAAPGAHHRIWANFEGRWISLGDLVPDQSGRAVAIADNVALGQRPSELVVTEQGSAGSAPTGRAVVRWKAP